MAEPIRLKVDETIYKQTLDSLKAQLDNLKTYRNDLKKQIDTLKSGNTFSGSEVQVAITKAENALENVNDAISRVTGYYMSIQQQLSGAQQAAGQLSSDMANIDLPNMFG